VPVVDVSGARLWYDEAGQGPAVVLLHGGLGDSGLWEPVVPYLAQWFRTIRTDLRFFGRSVGVAAPFSFEDDVVGLLDELGLERAALIGLSLGGGIAIDVALEHPERLWALAAVAPALSGHDGAAYTPEQEARYEEAEAAGDLEAMAAVDFEVWAPLGADERARALWRETPDANPLPAGVQPRPPRATAKPQLGRLAVPTLVITVTHDPAGFREVGPLIASAAPAARHVVLDSDHCVTLREPEELSRLLADFLAEAARNA
jgi:3-oxoadipate enol-lactonase